MSDPEVTEEKIRSQIEALTTDIATRVMREIEARMKAKNIRDPNIGRVSHEMYVLVKDKATEALLGWLLDSLKIKGK